MLTWSRGKHVQSCCADYVHFCVGCICVLVYPCWLMIFRNFCFILHHYFRGLLEEPTNRCIAWFASPLDFSISDGMVFFMFNHFCGSYPTSDSGMNIWIHLASTCWACRVTLRSPTPMRASDRNSFRGSLLMWVAVRTKCFLFWRTWGIFLGSRSAERDGDDGAWCEKNGQQREHKLHHELQTALKWDFQQVGLTRRVFLRESPHWGQSMKSWNDPLNSSHDPTMTRYISFHFTHLPVAFERLVQHPAKSICF